MTKNKQDLAIPSPRCALCLFICNKCTHYNLLQYNIFDRSVNGSRGYKLKKFKSCFCFCFHYLENYEFPNHLINFYSK